MADVFISYKKEDRALAEDAVASLARAGYSVWWDDRLTPTEHWDRLIEREIEAAKAVLVLWTARAVESDWVRIEANYGAEHSKLIQIRFGDCRPPLAYSMLQRVDMPAGAKCDGAPWRKALDWIALLAGRAAETVSESSAQTPPGIDQFGDVFKDLFGFTKGATQQAASGDIHHPIVLTLAEAAQGKELTFGPVDHAAAAEILRAQIPAGVAPGDKIRFKGKGAARDDGGVGDLYLVLAVRDESGFIVEGRDVSGELKITQAEAQGGAERYVTLPWALKLRVRVPPGAAGKTLRVAGHGLPGFGEKPPGDLYLKLRAD